MNTQRKLDLAWLMLVLHSWFWGLIGWLAGARLLLALLVLLVFIVLLRVMCVLSLVLFLVGGYVVLTAGF